MPFFTGVQSSPRCAGLAQPPPKLLLCAQVLFIPRRPSGFAVKPVMIRTNLRWACSLSQGRKLRLREWRGLSNQHSYLRVVERVSCSVVSDSLQTPWTVALQAPLSMGFSRQNTGVDCHFLLQWIFPTRGWNLGLLHGRQILYHLSHQGSPRILEWLAYPFSRESS